MLEVDYLQFLEECERSFDLITISCAAKDVLMCRNKCDSQNYPMCSLQLNKVWVWKGKVGDSHITKLDVSTVLTSCMHQISKQLPSINCVILCTFAFLINCATMERLTRLCAWS